MSTFIEHIQTEIDGVKEAGLYKHERAIVSSQSAKVEVLSGGSVLNFCANNIVAAIEESKTETIINKLSLKNNLITKKPTVIVTEEGIKGNANGMGIVAWKYITGFEIKKGVTIGGKLDSVIVASCTKEFKRTYKFAAYTSSFLTFLLTLVVGVFFYVTKIEMYWFIFLFAIICFCFSFFDNFFTLITL